MMINNSVNDDNFRGYVLGTEQEFAKPLDFSVFVAPGRYLQLDDVVHVQTILPDGEIIDIYGVVDEVIAKHEGVQLTSDVALVNEGVLPASSVMSAHISVTRIEPEIYIPPTPGDIVNIASEESREVALFFDGMDKRLPLGLSRGEVLGALPVYGNIEFINGKKGAHVNISGISGVATKTSYATYLLYSLFEGEVLGDDASNSTALIFNVKDEDLLFLDCPNRKLIEDKKIKDQYAKLGLPVGEFKSVGFYAPLRRDSKAKPFPDTGSRSENVNAFFWSLHEFCESGYLQFLFVDADTDQTQISLLVDNVSDHLRNAARKSSSEGMQIDGIAIENFDQLVEQIDLHLFNSQDDSYDTEQLPSWAGRGSGAASTGTIRAFMRRLRSAARHVGYLIREPYFEKEISDTNVHRIERRHQVNVIDLHKLHDRAQRFVVGVLLHELMIERESSANRSPIFVVVDELNKYAPRDGTSPIKDILIDIAERGRSLGVILIGAQQTASEVEHRVVGNAAFRVVGRLDGAEVERNEYRFLRTSSLRQRATLLTPGSMLIQQTDIPVPLLVRFPHPSWATRKSEVSLPTDKNSGRDIMGRF